MTERILDGIEQHAGDDAEAFNRWFFDGGDNLIHRVAKQKKRGGPIPRDVVRQARLEIVFDAFTYVGGTVCLQMQAFLLALPEPLEGRDRAAFEAMYFGQPYLGGLPLVMLKDRFEFIRGAAVELMDEPGDGRRVGILLRMLSYYAEMAGSRRDADRGSKRRALGRNGAGRVASALPLDAGDVDRASIPPEECTVIGEVAERLRHHREITCTCGPGVRWRARLFEAGADDRVEVELNCTQCGRVERFEAGRRDLARIGGGSVGQAEERPEIVPRSRSRSRVH